MGVALRLLSLLMIVSLSACFSTHVKPTTHHVSHSSHSKAKVYTVRRGDTLYRIGKRFGVKYKLIAQRNRLHSPYTVYVGQRLYITSRAPHTSKGVMHRLSKRRSLVKKKKIHGSHHVKRKIKKKRLRKHRKQSSKRKAAMVMKGRLLWPVKGVVTSRFGRRGSRMHDGIDIGVAEGTAVHASASGVVVYSDSRLSGYGNLIIVRHPHSVFTTYAHNQRNLVRKGDKVHAGELIARVGHTGRATGPHLHFEVRLGSTPVDPLAYLPR
ncbi:MAG: M23 family metallopeptidase [Mariprofundus sp.]|nr:M23 family metallopeptidase [Mariprofundus sp.]